MYAGAVSHRADCAEPPEVQHHASTNTATRLFGRRLSSMLPGRNQFLAATIRAYCRARRRPHFDARFILAGCLVMPFPPPCRCLVGDESVGMAVMGEPSISTNPVALVRPRRTSWRRWAYGLALSPFAAAMSQRECTVCLGPKVPRSWQNASGAVFTSIQLTRAALRPAPARRRQASLRGKPVFVPGNDTMLGVGIGINVRWSKIDTLHRLCMPTLALRPRPLLLPARALDWLHTRYGDLLVWTTCSFLTDLRQLPQAAQALLAPGDAARAVVSARANWPMTRIPDTRDAARRCCRGLALRRCALGLSELFRTQASCYRFCRTRCTPPSQGRMLQALAF